MAEYSPSSPWYNTQQTQWYLDRLSVRPINAEITDLLYTIDSRYHWRPDLLAHKIYNNSNLWWVFVQRNLDVLRDPIFDFTTGTKIYIPREDKLKELLGL